jgi:hypothetical protein
LPLHHLCFPNVYFPAPPSVLASMFYHFEPDNNFAIRCIQIALNKQQKTKYFSLINAIYLVSCFMGLVFALQTLQTMTQKTLLYLKNMKWSHVSIYCDIITMGVVEHERSLRGTQGIAKCFSDFSSALQLPGCSYKSI